MTSRATIVRGLEHVDPVPSVVTIGNFDGVHRGHQLLLERTVDDARTRGVRSAVLTFDPHPAAVLRPGAEPKLLASLDERTALLAQAGVDLVVVLPFTRELSASTPGAFVEDVLVRGLRAVKVIVGINFRFGHGAAGDTNVLSAAGHQHGFEVEALTLQSIDDSPVSSSSIRAGLASGDVEFVTRALGRDFGVSGPVVQGDGRGRTIGVPTANVDVKEEHALPAPGVYAGLCRVGSATYPCVTNVGVRPTATDGSTLTVECHLIGVERDLYGQLLDVTFAHRLRAEQRFGSIDELTAQIRRDIDRATVWLAENRSSELADPRH